MCVDVLFVGGGCYMCTEGWERCVIDAVGIDYTRLGYECHLYKGRFLLWACVRLGNRSKEGCFADIGKLYLERCPECGKILTFNFHQQLTSFSTSDDELASD